LKFDTFPGKVKDLDAWMAKQAVFIDRLNMLYKRAEQGGIDLCFSDASHFVYGKFCASGWMQGPTYMPSDHGRHRINVYGSFDAVGRQVFSMYNKAYVDAKFMVEYLNWLRQECYTDRITPLHLVLDNARYQHYKLLKGVAENLNIILEFLPPYSPNLNIIERLLKQLKTRGDLKKAVFHADERWSFVECKNNKAGIWVVYDPYNKQLIAFHIGGRGKDSAAALWAKIPEKYRKYCDYATDYWGAYNSVIPDDQHVIGKAHTHNIKGIFASFRTRGSRLVRRSQSFSKKWANHEAAIGFFFWPFNLGF
jgi:IS1 family transposase